MELPADLECELAAVRGTVSVWCGPPGGPPAYARLADASHNAASTMKLVVLLAAYRLAGTGRLDLGAEVEIHPEFPSADGTSRFRVLAEDDGDDVPWQRVGEYAPLSWLAERMIVRSSNLATDLVLEQVGLPAVEEAWRVCGAGGSAVTRGIGDYAAADLGKHNVVTAADLAAVLGAIARGEPASPASCTAILATLAANEYNDEIPAGLPPGTPVAHKNGWLDGVRHDAGVVEPGTPGAYVLVVCTTSDLPDADASALVARIAAATWAARH